MERVAHKWSSKKRTSDVEQSKVSFEDMCISETVLRGLKDAGFVKPSPIQLKSIPLGKCGFGAFKIYY